MRTVAFCIVAFACCPLSAQDKPTALNIKLNFASREEAATALSVEDEFVQRLSPFDRSARLKSDEPVDKATYLKFVTEQTLEWTDAEKQVVKDAWQRVMEGLAGASIQAPDQVTMIKTTGMEEGDAAYTRGTAIILSKRKAAGRNLDALMAHELFHVLSRNDPALRERLYKLIGFRKCGELELPADVQVRRLTNPDAPVNNHCIQVKQGGQSLWVVPILISRSAKYDKKAGGEFFDYLVFELMAIESPDTPVSKPLIKDGKPVLLSPKTAEGFMDQIGQNTGYIIHPDEVLADNFSMLMTKRKDVRQPELLEKIEKALKSK